MVLHALSGFQEPSALPERILELAPVGDLVPLVTTGAGERIAALARLLAVPVQTVCYEVRLGRGDDRADYAVCLLPGFEAHFQRELERLGRAPDPAWGQALDFVRAWTAEGSELLSLVPFLCLAFDLDGASNAVAPCVSVCVDPDFFLRRHGFAPAARSVEGQLEVIAECHQRLLATPLAGASRERSMRCLAAPDALPVHASFMLSRSPATFKLDVRVPVDRVAAFLTDAGWAQDAPQVEDGIRELVTWPGAVQLNLVVSEEPGGPLEVELLTRANEASPLQRSTLLEALVARGLVAEEKAAVLEQVTASPLVASTSGFGVARNWYVKVRFLRARPLDAKVYLAHMPRPVRAPGTRAAAGAPAHPDHLSVEDRRRVTHHHS